MQSSNQDTVIRKALTRDEIIKHLAFMEFDFDHCDFIHAREDQEPHLPFMDHAKEILDWLDSIGYYNLHFYGVATRHPRDAE